MKSLLETINESKDTKVYYAIKFIDGKNKSRYLGGDGEGFIVTNLSFQHGDKNFVMVYTNINSARKALAGFNDWSKGSWGDATIVEITMTETIVK